MTLAHDDILMHLRFFDAALAQLHVEERGGTGCLATDGQTLFYDPVYVLKLYRERPQYVSRVYLHMLLHCIFSHSFQYDRLEGELWDMAADIAVENVILDMGSGGAALEQDGEAAGKLKVLREDIGPLTAERIYRYFRKNPPTQGERRELTGLFFRDVHSLWKPAQQLELTREQWKKISERVRAELKSFTRGKAGAETLEKNLEEAVRERFDYSQILRRFAVTGEDLAVSDDELSLIHI